MHSPACMDPGCLGRASKSCNQVCLCLGCHSFFFRLPLGPWRPFASRNIHTGSQHFTPGLWESCGVASSMEPLKCAPLLYNSRSRSNPVLNINIYKLTVWSYSATPQTKVDVLKTPAGIYGGKGGSCYIGGSIKIFRPGSALILGPTFANRTR